MARAVGIDLGTTYSVVVFLEGGEPTVIPNAEGERTTPSVVAFSRTGELLVGGAAHRQAVTNVERTVRSVKRYMGSDWAIDIDGKVYTAQEIAARVLGKLKRDAEEYLGEEITKAVITVPAYFNDAQRTATKEAAEIAGLCVLRIIGESTAAALAYGLDKGRADELILVFDLGGGTLDISLVEVGKDEDGFSTVQVRATSGDNFLGGDDWTRALVDHLVRYVLTRDGVDLSKDAVAHQRLREAAEQAKKELSSSTGAVISLQYLARTVAGFVNLDTKITRAQFEEMTSPLRARIEAPFRAVVKDAGVSLDDIDHILLVGGSTRMPAVRAMIRELSGGMTPHRSINPDEVVAIGAALQAGVLTGELRDVLLLDVTPLSLGVETKGGIMTRLLERNTAIPTKAVEVFSTAYDKQTEFEVRLYQGERSLARENKFLGTFTLTGLPAAPEGETQIEIILDVDANGLVHVSAKHRGTGVEESMTVTGGNGLTKDEIDNMIKNAELHAEEDRIRRRDAESRNRAQRLIYSTEKFLAENDANLTAGGKAKVGKAIDDLNAALTGESIDNVLIRLEILAEAGRKLALGLHPRPVPPEPPIDGGADGEASGAKTAGTASRGGPHDEGSDSRDDLERESGFYSTTSPGARPPRADYFPPAVPVGQKIFISYRQSATGHFAGRLADALMREFGDENVFFDVESVRPGLDYTEVIRRHLRESAVVLTPIGEGWLDAADRAGRRRLDLPGDPVRLEIEMALALRVRVIPVLINGAEMPRRDQLPGSIAQLGSRNAVHVRHTSFRHDVSALIGELRSYLGGPRP